MAQHHLHLVRAGRLHHLDPAVVQRDGVLPSVAPLQLQHLEPSGPPDPEERLVMPGDDLPLVHRDDQRLLEGVLRETRIEALPLEKLQQRRVVLTEESLVGAPELLIGPALFLRLKRGHRRHHAAAHSLTSIICVLSGPLASACNSAEATLGKPDPMDEFRQDRRKPQSQGDTHEAKYQGDHFQVTLSHVAMT
jgi:hypothetical protein